MTNRKRSNQRGGRSKPADKPAATATVPAPAAPRAVPLQRFDVRIENLLSTPLEVSVLAEDGSVQGLRLGPRATSHTINRDRVGPRTFDLEARGHVRIRNED